VDRQNDKGKPLSLIKVRTSENRQCPGSHREARSYAVSRWIFPLSRVRVPLHGTRQTDCPVPVGFAMMTLPGNQLVVLVAPLPRPTRQPLGLCSGSGLGLGLGLWPP
jgi:hypothetical protein